MKKKKIPVFDWNFPNEYRKKFHEGVDKIFDEAYLSNHTYVRKFEEDFKGLNNSSHATFVSNGTTALEMALRATDVRGKEVILPTNTFIATHIAILNAGGIPKVVDIENEFYSMDIEKMNDAISERTAAIIVVHIGGHIARDILKMVDVCKKKNIILIEDSAQAFGATLDGVRAGNFGDIGCYSLFLTKVMTTGEGGVIVTNNSKYNDEFVSIRQFGKSKDLSISHIRDGSNFKVTEFQGLLGVLELERVTERIGKRRILAERYQENLNGSDWKLVHDNNGSKGCYYKQIMISDHDRGTVVRKCAEYGIPMTGGVYDIPLHRQPVYKDSMNEKDFPISNYFSDQHICPPCFPELELEDIDYICDVLRRVI